jgi:CRISPR/Cas system CSM-associated protein Csm3 (group 7 of RAMP superfamily)
MFDTFQSRLTVAGYLIADGPLHVGTGRVSAVTGTELPVIRDTISRPFIPGSSFKGALRSHLEALVRSWCDSPFCACNPVDENEQCIRPGGVYSKIPDWEYPKDTLVLAKPVGIEDLFQGLKDIPSKDRERKFTERLLANTCLLCQVFGSPWLASPVRVRDLPGVTDEWFGQFDVRDGVAIDRDKGTVAVGPYDYEAVPAGTRFELHIVAENLADWQRGLLWLGLRALERGDVALGGFTSRGLGWVKLKDPEVRFLEGGDALLELLGGAEVGKQIDDKEAKPWVKAFHERLSGKGAQHA